MNLSLWAIVLSGATVLARSHGRAFVRQLADRRRHPARMARLVAAVAAVTGGGAIVVGQAVQTAARPVPPQGSAVIVGIDSDGPRPATFVLINEVPGNEADPAPLTSSGASF